VVLKEIKDVIKRGYNIPSVIIKLSNGMTARFVMKNKPGN
jgi:hypothetical protein